MHRFRALLVSHALCLVAFGAATAQVPVTCDETGVVLTLGSLKSRYADIPITIRWDPKNSSNSSCLGLGWDFPFLDSRVVEGEDGRLLWKTISGRMVTIDLRRSKDFSVTQNSSNETIIADQFGWKFVYVGGRIKAVVTPDAEVFRIDRDGSGSVNVRDNKGFALILGKDKKLSLNNNSFELESGKLAQWSGGGSQSVVAALEQSVVKVSNGGRTIFQIDEELENSPMRTLRIGTSEIQLKFNEGVWESTTPEVSSTTERVVADENGRAVWRDASGLRYERRVFQSGPLSGKIRYEKVTDPSTGSIRKRQFRYDENGTILGYSD